ncbi:MAG: response regulator transcription factor [Planctomycetota bacterium]|jgi:FixJ family two-component response regulator
MNNHKPTVFVVDDDAAVLKGLRLLIKSTGHNVKTFASAEEFLDSYDSSWGCLVLDIRMPEITGLELQRILNERKIDIPVIFITGHGDVSTAIKAMKNGAMDYIEKPFDDNLLLNKIEKALKKDDTKRKEKIKVNEIRKLFHTLTKKEHEIMALAVQGKTSKEIAPIFGISHKTVEVHRTNIMEKLGVRSAVQMTKLAFEAKLC